jgi:hypothetical protein
VGYLKTERYIKVLYLIILPKKAGDKTKCKHKRLKMKNLTTNLKRQDLENNAKILVRNLQRIGGDIEDG